MRSLALVLTFLLFSFLEVRIVPSKAVAATSPSQVKPAQSVSQVQASSQLLTAPQLFRQFKPAVVKIMIKQQDILVGWGTGFFISKDGELVTNYHVIRNALKTNSFQAEFLLGDGRIIRQFQVGRCQDTRGLDLCLLKLPVKPQSWFTPSQYTPSPGETVYVIGHPQGLDFTITNGIVSALRESPSHVKELQITAAISPGNSGGPIFNSRGTLLGVASKFLRDGQNLNFGIQTSEVQNYKSGNQKYISATQFQRSFKSQIEKKMNSWMQNDLSPALELALQGQSFLHFNTFKSVKMQFGEDMIKMTMPSMFGNCIRQSDKPEGILYNCGALNDAAVLSVQRIPAPGDDSLLALHGKQILKAKPLPIVENLIKEGLWAQTENALSPEAKRKLFSAPGIASCQNLRTNPLKRAMFSSHSIACYFSVHNDSEPDAYSYSIWIQNKNHVYGFHIWMDDQAYAGYFKHVPSLAMLTTENESATFAPRNLASNDEKKFSLKLVNPYSFVKTQIVDKASTIHLYGKGRTGGGAIGPSIFVVQEIKESFSPKELERVSENLFQGTLSGFGARIEKTLTQAKAIKVDGMPGRMFFSQAQKDKEKMLVFHTTLLSEKATYLLFGYADPKEGRQALIDFQKMCNSFKRKLALAN